MTNPRGFDIIASKYPEAIWVHGGASGFDTQVHLYAKEHSIDVLVIRPNYKEFPGKIAPLKRNETIVETCDVIYACYDGRNRGGTLYTINYARKIGKPVRLLHAQKQPK